VVWPDASERTCPYFHALSWNLALDCVSSKEAALDWFQSRGLSAFLQMEGSVERGLDRLGNVPSLLKWYGYQCATVDPKEAKVIAKARAKFLGYWDTFLEVHPFRDIPVPWWGVDAVNCRRDQAPLAYHVDPGQVGATTTPTLRLRWLAGENPGVPIPRDPLIVPERPHHPGTPARTEWALWGGTLDYSEQGPFHVPLRHEGLLQEEAAALPPQEEEDRGEPVVPYHGPVLGMPAQGTLLVSAGRGRGRWAADIEDVFQLVPGASSREQGGNAG